MAGPAVRCLAGAAVALWALNADAIGQALPDLMDRCFARNYAAAHLRDHAGQDVVGISARFLEYEGGPATQLRFTTRDGSRFFIHGTCQPAAEGAIACDVCLGDGCEPTGETFRLVPRSGSLLFYNDSTGVTAASEGSGPDRRLDPGGEHRVFRLDAADRSACPV